MNSCIVIRLAVYRLSVNVEFTLPDIATFRDGIVLRCIMLRGAGGCIKRFDN